MISPGELIVKKGVACNMGVDAIRRIGASSLLGVGGIVKGSHERYGCEDCFCYHAELESGSITARELWHPTSSLGGLHQRGRWRWLQEHVDFQDLIFLCLSL